MEQREVLIKMLHQLTVDMQVLQQLGAGYYTCIPVANRYNKLLAQAKQLFGDAVGIVSTFEELPEVDPKDPGEKMKVLQGIRIEIGQLITLLEATQEGKA